MIIDALAVRVPFKELGYVDTYLMDSCMEISLGL